MARTIAVVNQKGGVGKTTTVVNLGVGLAREGYRVLLIDADPQGNLTSCMGWDGDDIEKTLSYLLKSNINDEDSKVNEVILSHEEGVDVIPSNIELAALDMQLINAMNRERVLSNSIKDVSDKYDYILVDCGPTLNLITINALVAADSVVIPVQAQNLATKGLEQLMQTIIKVKRHINPELEIDGLLVTMVDYRTTASKTIPFKLEQQYGKYFKVFDTKIPNCEALSKTTETGKSIFEFEKGRSKAAAAYCSLTSELTQRTEKNITKDTINSERVM